MVKEKTEPKFQLKIAIRDRDHFYNIVRYLNKHVGKGKDNWNMTNGVLKKLNNYGHADAQIRVYKDGFCKNEIKMFLLL